MTAIIDYDTGNLRSVAEALRRAGADRTADGPLKVPHMGWDTVDMLRGPLFEGIDAQTYVYYVHSYAPRLCDAAIAATDYGMRFSAALARDNFFGTQFHPEKSGAAGSRILRNFLTLK